MEKHKCKLCLKSFANGRALGGHMRSHMLNLYLTPKSPSFLSSEEDEDPEFAFPGAVSHTAAAAGGGGSGGVGGGDSVVLQDRESETETSKKATARRRSKRIRRQGISWFGDEQHFHDIDRNKNQNQNQNQWQYLKKSKIFKPSTPEPVSSISDTSPEEDVAHCLMMLSRDKWADEEEDQEHEETDTESESGEFNLRQFAVKRAPARTKYRCETCNRVFRSYQALGGHRASHKKIKQSHHENNNQQTQIVSMEDKIHECPVCFKVFASGQALGGHKRSHVNVTASSASMATDKPVKKQRINLIDLNLPAPIDEEEDDDEISQIEVSVISDGEFVITH